MNARFRRMIAATLIVPVLALGLPAPAQAGLQDRERVVELLVANGVDPAQASARAAALTDEEAARIAAEIDTLPAGGDAVLGILALAVILYVAAVAALVGATMKGVGWAIEKAVDSARQPGSTPPQAPRYPEPRY